MEKDSNAAGGPEDRSARELLEGFLYGHVAEIEAIIRFARQHGLDDDNLVFLLVSILKVNEVLVQRLLSAIDAAERVIDNSKQAGSQLRALAQTLTAQMAEVANSNAGHLNLAADRLTRSIVRAEDLCGHIVRASQDLQGARSAFEQAVGLSEGSKALDSLLDHIRTQARVDLREYHAEVITELEHTVGREAWAIHLYGIVGLIVLTVFILLSVAAR